MPKRLAAIGPVPKGVKLKVSDCNLSSPDIGIATDGGSVELDNVKFTDTPNPIIASGGEVWATKTRTSFNGSRSHSYGWAPSTGPRIPCHCPKCESVFPSRTFTMFNVKVYAKDGTETCPVCRCPDAKISTGLFEATRELLTILAAPQTTVEDLMVLREIVSSALSGEKTVDSAMSEIGEKFPDIWAVINRTTRVSKAVGGVCFAGLVFFATLPDAADGYNFIKDTLKAFFDHTFVQEAIGDDRRREKSVDSVDEDPHDKSNQEPPPVKPASKPGHFDV